MNRPQFVASVLIVINFLLNSACAPQKQAAGSDNVIREDVFDPQIPTVQAANGGSSFTLSHADDIISTGVTNGSGRSTQAQLAGLREIDLTSILKFDSRPGHTIAEADLQVSCSSIDSTSQNVSKITEKIILRNPKEVSLDRVIPGSYILRFFAREDVPEGSDVPMRKTMVMGHCYIEGILKGQKGSSKRLDPYKFQLIFEGMRPNTDEFTVKGNAIRHYQTLSPEDLRNASFSSQTANASGTMKLQCQSDVRRMQVRQGTVPDYYQLLMVKTVNGASDYADRINGFTDSRATNPFQLCQITFLRDDEVRLVSPIFGFKFHEGGALKYDVLQERLQELPYAPQSGQTSFYKVRVTNLFGFPVRIRVNKDTGQSLIAAGVFMEIGFGQNATIGADFLNKIKFVPMSESLVDVPFSILSENEIEQIIEIKPFAKLVIASMVSSPELARVYWFDGHAGTHNHVCGLAQVFYDFVPRPQDPFGISEIYPVSKKIHSSGRILLNFIPTTPIPGTPNYNLNTQKYPAFESAILYDGKTQREGMHFSNSWFGKVRSRIKSRNTSNEPNSHNGACRG